MIQSEKGSLSQRWSPPVARLLTCHLFSPKGHTLLQPELGLFFLTAR